MSRASHLRLTYGITEEQYDYVLRQQGGSCAICKRSAKLFKTRLAVDHNHKTGEIRGLLCIHCNRRVIGRHTDPDLFRAAAEYLSQGTGWIVPKKKPKRRKKRGKNPSNRAG